MRIPSFNKDPSFGRKVSNSVGALWLSSTWKLQIGFNQNLETSMNLYYRKISAYHFYYFFVQFPLKISVTCKNLQIKDHADSWLTSKIQKVFFSSCISIKLLKRGYKMRFYFKFKLFTITLIFTIATLSEKKKKKFK